MGRWFKPFVVCTAQSYYYLWCFLWILVYSNSFFYYLCVNDTFFSLAISIQSDTITLFLKVFNKKKLANFFNTHEKEEQRSMYIQFKTKQWPIDNSQRIFSYIVAHNVLKCNNRCVYFRNLEQHSFRALKLEHQNLLSVTAHETTKKKKQKRRMIPLTCVRIIEQWLKVNNTVRSYRMKHNISIRKMYLFLSIKTVW